MCDHNCDTCSQRGSCSVPTEDPKLKERINEMKHKVLVLSGKGGVGKSTFTCQLAQFLSSTLLVGVCDIDICGPSIPVILGTRGATLTSSLDGIEPVYVNPNLSTVSIGYLLEQEKEAVIWRGPLKNGLINQFLKEVNWGELDVLLIDTPPGTSDEHITICTTLAKYNVDGAVIVTTPQNVALDDVKKEINFCKKIGVKVLGVVENMKGFVCPCCGKVENIFSDENEVQKMCKEFDVEYLGGIPLDPQLTRLCDEGKDFFENAQGKTTEMFGQVAKNFCKSVGVEQ